MTDNRNTVYREGDSKRAPSFMTNEKMYGEAPYRGFGEQTDPVLGERPAFGETGLLALYGMETDIRTYSPLALAFLGDAVYSLIIRTTVVARGNRQAEKLHNETTRLVRAQKQAAVGRAIYDLLTTEEQKVYRRGRNSHPLHHAKGASLEEYLQATALETLCGWLYLQGRNGRLLELIRTGLELTKRRNGDPLL
ncbi:MAG: ribonuclease III domain-containing protein [Eubacteriales bacterium]|nr:ribonuclease III domain-containing protein [Eubacteriales bacterium]